MKAILNFIMFIGKIIIFLAMMLIGITPLFFAGIMATKTKLQAISFIKELPDDSIMYLGIAIGLCCVLVMTYGLLRLIGMKNVEIKGLRMLLHKENCLNCRFNDGMYCNVGTYYAEKGINGVCYEGELWQKKRKNNEFIPT